MIIRIKDLRVERPTGILCDLPTLEVQRGEHVCIEGSNGSGKSTLLRVLAGVELDYKGTVEVAASGTEITYMHQHPYLFHGTVLSNVAYGLRARGLNRREAAEKAQPWIERCGLTEFAARQAGGLSGGERRRVALARAFALDPVLLLLDEPLSDLDAAGAKILEQALAHVRGMTILMTSPKGETAGLTQRTITLQRP
ncbi:MAG: ABC-type nitrate/sulfonate/bicarbonate transport system ATPase subunit [Planctomycetota bacterium]